MLNITAILLTVSAIAVHWYVRTRKDIKKHAGFLIGFGFLIFALWAASEFFEVNSWVTIICGFFIMVEWVLFLWQNHQAYQNRERPKRPGSDWPLD